MELRFPIQSGFNNYFSWVGLSLCQSLPVNITVGLFMFYRSIATLPRITSKLVWGMGWNYFFGEMLLGMVFTVPSWIVNVVISYYAVERLLGIGVNTFYNGLITSLFLFAVFWLMWHYLKAGPELALSPNDFDDIKFPPGYKTPAPAPAADSHGDASGGGQTDLMLNPLQQQQQQRQRHESHNAGKVEVVLT